MGCWAWSQQLLLWKPSGRGPGVGKVGTRGPFFAGPPGMVSSRLERASWGGGRPLWRQADAEPQLQLCFWFCLLGHLLPAVVLAGGQRVEGTPWVAGAERALTPSPVRPLGTETSPGPGRGLRPGGPARGSEKLPASRRLRRTWTSRGQLGAGLCFYPPGEKPNKQNRVTLGPWPNKTYFGSGDLFLWVIVHWRRF